MTVRVPQSGALVVSLDFELAWGVRDTLGSDGSYRAHLLGARDVVPRLLELFVHFETAATWATVGLLFCSSREEAIARAPTVRPTYHDPRLDPFVPLERGEIGSDETRDPVHFAPTLIRQVAASPRQELASHTYSHLYPMEPGVTQAAVAADLAAARDVGRAYGHDLRSLVMPRHQVRAIDLPVVAKAGFLAYRGPEPNGLNRPRSGVGGRLIERGLRLADAYVSLTGANDAAWPKTDEHGLVDVPESRFLRPAGRGRRLDHLHVDRIIAAMTVAARRGHLCHVWWHPHNFGAEPERNLAMLRRLLEAYTHLRDTYGFESLTMGSVAERVRDRPASVGPAHVSRGSLSLRSSG